MTLFASYVSSQRKASAAAKLTQLVAPASRTEEKPGEEMTRWISASLLLKAAVLVTPCPAALLGSPKDRL